MSLEPFESESNYADPEYGRNQVRSITFLVLLLLVLLVAVVLSLCAGSYDTPIAELVRGIFGKATDNKINVIVQNNRLPRILTAVIAGAGLGVSGCVLQAILRNPLASASTLGVSQGAGFGAAFAIIVLNMGTVGGLGSAAIPLCAFVGSMAVALVILGLSKLRQVSPEGIVLAGVAISAMFTGATTLIQYFANEIQLATLVFWTFGDLGGTNWGDVRLMGSVVLVVSVYFILHRWDYNALLSGSETAISLGINVRRLTMINMILCCFTASTIVSYIGLISFIGLVAPHIVRLVVGNNHVYLIPGSILAGATLLLLGDLFARVVISPVILPIGAITSFLGGPLFLYLLFKGGKKSAEG
ncbi:MAG: iron ABC transporter permease [Angelakisella sp.]